MNKNMKKYLLALLLVSALAGVATTPAVLAKNENNKGPGQMMSRPEVLGTVTAISGNTITVKDLRVNSGTIYTVDATNATVIKNGSASTVSAILVNDTVSVQGVLNGTNVTATKINDGLKPKEKDEIMGKPRTIGTVTAISGTTLTIKDIRKNSAITYTVNTTSSTVIMKNGNTAVFTSIAMGDKVSVQGTITGTTITATKINVGQNENELENEKNLNNPIIVGDGSPVVAGTVASISGNTITIKNKSNVTYTIDATNAKVQSNGSVSTVSGIAVNDNVIVQGTINGTSVTASLIIDQKTKTANPNNDQNENKPKPRGFWGGIGNWFKNLFGF